MIDFGYFQFATAPRTGTTWMLKAGYICGLGEMSKTNAHTPHREGNSDKLKVSFVRHPCDWLASYYIAIGKGRIGVSDVDKFSELNQMSFDTFVRDYLDSMPGQIGRMFSAYNSDSQMRIEDMPLALYDFLESFGIPSHVRERVLVLDAQNRSKSLPLWSPSLYQRVLTAEKEFTDEYQYWY